MDESDHSVPGFQQRLKAAFYDIGLMNFHLNLFACHVYNDDDVQDGELHIVDARRRKLECVMRPLTTDYEVTLGHCGNADVHLHT